MQGDEPTHVFTVEIANTKNVSALKDYIKDKNPEAFRNVDARSISLWQVSIPVDDSFKENLQKEELTDQKLLPVVKRLNGLFVNQPMEGHLHFIVKHNSESL